MIIINDEMKTIMEDLLTFANRNRCVVTQVNIDLNQEVIQATMYHYKTGEKRVLYYTGASWSDIK